MTEPVECEWFHGIDGLIGCRRSRPLIYRRSRYRLTGQFNRSNKMKEIQASAAKARLAELLDEVERGETIVITRHGQPIARLVPDPARRQRDIEQAIADIRAMRREGRATVAEILAWRDEGRR